MSKKILVTGGAGYIGSNCIRLLLKQGYDVIVLDNLSRGHKKAIPEEITFIKGDLSDENLLNEIFKENKIDAVIHFAGFIEAGESMKNPKIFFENNVINGIKLLDIMMKYNVKKIIYSSSAGIYTQKTSQLNEDDEKNPSSFYGETKLIFEKILNWYDKIYNLKSVCLRYFNAAGADFEIGEDHNPETHLIPLVLQVALGKRDFIKIFGIDYNTKDGTCVRDYIHVTDLSKAHILALDYLLQGGESKKYNLGSGKGYSVREIINKIEEITGKKISVVETERRAGDPETLIADSLKIKKELSWVPEKDLTQIISSAWNWHKENPEGFSKI